MLTRQEMLDSAIPRLDDIHLERYIRAYEEGSVKQRACCAVQQMEGGSAGDYLRTLSSYGGEYSPALVKAHGLAAPPFALIELVFEGWRVSQLSNSETQPSEERARMIYDSCILEQARRAGARRVPTEAKEVAV